MGRKEDNIRRASEIMGMHENIRNVCIAAHIDHGKTTLSDNLIAGAGMMSEDLAGKGRVLDFDDQESARGITINAASASMVHSINETDYLINLIDTPGHVDFGGDVTRAMRAVDGCYILVCAVEGPMPQTETVVRQALREKVKPVLFINKVDRLINEMQVTPEDMQARFMETIAKVNKLIRDNAPE
ncbi:MAG TPA: GTP-binding protein, partial [Candidatus Poseidoniales archaeon]|nr:GTP-binding protein [Candidatus Poseidoniales archaeon]